MLDNLFGGFSICAWYRKGSAFCVLMLVASFPVAAAVQPCPLLPVVSISPSEKEWREVSDYLSENLTDCLKSPSFFALYGASLLNTGKVSQAIEMLERALLLSPDHGGALVDYAGALYYSGEVHSAIQVNRSILQRNDIPLNLRPLLLDRQKGWESSRVRWQSRFTVLGGYSDNLNGVANLDELTLTIDDTELQVPLDDSSKPIAGGYLNSRLATQRVKRVEQGFSRFSMALQNSSNKLSRVDSNELSLEYMRENRHRNGHHLWEVDATYLFYNDEELYYSLGGRLARHWSFSTCTPFLQVDARAMLFPNINYMDDVSFDLEVGTSCGSAVNQLTISTLLRNSRALRDRVGGNRTGAEFNLKWQYVIGSGIIFSQVVYGGLLDQKGYSPLLKGNVRRENKNINFLAQYVRPLGKDWSFHMGYYYRRQDSNLELFQTHSSNVDVGLSVAF